MQTTKSVEPFLKWAGGKRNLMPQIEPYIPTSFNAYFEPFLGGGAMFFCLQPEKAYLNDINSELINAYRCVRYDVDQIIQYLSDFKIAHCDQFYYHARDFIPEDRIERAARFIYLNKTCFNGLYRENSKGLFNVPVGKYKNPNICDVETLQEASRVLNSAWPTLSNESYLRLMARPVKNDFVYFDPPYAPASETANFTGYNASGFTLEDQKTLAAIFTNLVDRGVKCLLSNSDTPIIRELYKEFKIVEIQRKGSINSKGSKRGPVNELLIVGH